ECKKHGEAEPLLLMAGLCHNGAMSYSRRAVGPWAFGGVGLVGCAAIFLLFKSVTGPARATNITTAIQTPATVAASFNLQPVTVTNPYAHFTYPAALTAIPTQALHGAEVASYSYGFRDSESWQLTITITRLADPSLSDDSGYSFRKINPQIYQ